MIKRIADMIAGRRKDADGTHRRARQLSIGFLAQSVHRSKMGQLRRTLLGAAAAAVTPGRLKKMVDGLNDVAAANAAETSSWLTADQVRDGASGPFEACSLMSWLAIAEKAGVAAIPATPILHLDDAEMDAASGTLPNLTGPIPDRIRERVRRELERTPDTFGDAPPTPSPVVDLEALVEKMHAAMDDLPPDVVVRSDQCGAASLKVLAGSGLVDETVPEISFGPDLEIGPGWVRNGNRRRIDASDRRIGTSYAEGPHRGMTFVVRPWVKANRFGEGRDPHRAGTPFDAIGLWPAEWRAFVRNGVVEGVSSYYGWIETPSPLTATKAIEVRDLAQRIVDAAIAQGLSPRGGRIEMSRRCSPVLAAALDEQGFEEGSFAATLDFIETDQGMLLLEGGPGHTPAGGGHPCAFTGTRGPLRLGCAAETIGVAFRLMPQVSIMKHEHASDGDRSGCILGWDEVEALSAEHPMENGK